MANYPYNYNPYIQEYQAMRDRIDSNIRQMQQQQMQQNQMIPQQPITQNFQIAPVQQQNDLQAKYVNSIDDVRNTFVVREGLFVNKEMNTLWVKNINGDIKTYSLAEIIEIDPKDREISELKNEIKSMRELLSQQTTKTKSNKSEKQEVI